MPVSAVLPYLGIVVLICFSAFFSGSEIAYASVNTGRLKKAADAGDRRSQTAYLICARYEDALCTILVGNNLVNIASSSVATVIAIGLAGDGGVAIATAVMTVVILIFGEIVPKIVAKDRCEDFALLAGLPLRVLMWVTRPIVIAVNWAIGRMARLWGEAPAEGAMTADELRTIIETVEDEGVIDEERSDLLRSAITFGDTTVQEILTPRVDMEAIDLSEPREEQLALLMESTHSRLPVYDGDVDRVDGVLYLNQVFKALAADPQCDLRSLIQPVCLLHRSAKLLVALSELRHRRQHLAVVLDDYGGTSGVVTLEDILEELVGELWDESDRVAPELRQTGEHEYLVSGNMLIEDLLDELEVETDYDGDCVTVGGWAVEALGRFPQEGDVFSFANLTLAVTELSELRVKTVRVTVAPVTEDEE